jgi:hypothetical protein
LRYFSAEIIMISITRISFVVTVCVAVLCLTSSLSSGADVTSLNALESNMVAATTRYPKKTLDVYVLKKAATRNEKVLYHVAIGLCVKDKSTDENCKEELVYEMQPESGIVASLFPKYKHGVPETDRDGVLVWNDRAILVTTKSMEDWTEKSLVASVDAKSSLFRLKNHVELDAEHYPHYRPFNLQMAWEKNKVFRSSDCFDFVWRFLNYLGSDMKTCVHAAEGQREPPSRDIIVPAHYADTSNEGLTSDEFHKWLNTHEKTLPTVISKIERAVYRNPGKDFEAAVNNLNAALKDNLQRVDNVFFANVQHSGNTQIKITNEARFGFVRASNKEKWFSSRTTFNRARNEMKNVFVDTRSYC